ncbi:hypothetical protein [Nocardioides sp. InS609-2]|uniref:hypothetical protein n=1 Tax=Nocardioides sp. InS609-2 TaxID=2760705 RepID=UPI0020C019BE|nr:hypothetical protein [Nocardioides sp. InS609-2]
MKIRLTSAAVATMSVVALSGCGSDGNQGGTDVGKYEQTWPRAYSETTCDDWADEMTGQQHFAAAADMLTSARNKIDGGEGLPPDSLIERFQSDIASTCQIEGTLTITDAVYVVYNDDPSYKP